MNVDLGSLKTIVVQEAQTVDAQNLTILRIVDLPIDRKVFVRIKELAGAPIMLWEDSEYDANVNWTKSDIDTRIKAVLNK